MTRRKIWLLRDGEDPDFPDGASLFPERRRRRSLARALRDRMPDLWMKSFSGQSGGLFVVGVILSAGLFAGLCLLLRLWRP